MEIPKELQGYPAERLRVRIGNNMYKGLEEIPQELRDSVVDCAITHLHMRDPTTPESYPLGTEDIELWYAPKCIKIYKESRSLAEPRENSQRMGWKQVWPPENDWNPYFVKRAGP